MKFTKMHGIGNDYVYVNAFEERIKEPANLAITVADRHFGIGGDGLILVCPPSPGVQADVRMRMFNADGSESEMCGNGIRCVCKFAHDRGISTANPMKIETGNGVLTVRYTVDGGGKVNQVTVDMGAPMLVAEKIPGHTSLVTNTHGQVVAAPFEPFEHDHPELRGAWHNLAGLDRHVTAVSMGNPHITIFVKDVTRVPLETVGPILEHDKRFPRRINVHFVSVHHNSEITMRTWERGSGITLACGTGASAVCVAGVLTGKSARKILAHLPGGDLTLEWRESDNHVYMTGPATEVFQGVWPD